MLGTFLSIFHVFKWLILTILYRAEHPSMGFGLALEPIPHPLPSQQEIYETHIHTRIHPHTHTSNQFHHPEIHFPKVGLFRIISWSSHVNI